VKPIVSDEILRASVIKELQADPELVAKHISVTAIDGAVILAGHVTTIHEKHEAVRAAERAEAVRAVADEIEVREPSLHERGDDQIAEEIAHLRSHGSEIPDSVAVQVRQGRVILHGDVESVSERDSAESAVRRLTGVQFVDNLIKVQAPMEPTAVDIEQRVHEELEQTVERHARSIHVTLNNGVAELSGHVPSSAALQIALDAAATTPGVRAVESEIVVTAPDA
jgi:osmotically-inducible protein OsmY